MARVLHDSTQPPNKSSRAPVTVAKVAAPIYFQLLGMPALADRSRSRREGSEPGDRDGLVSDSIGDDEDHGSHRGVGGSPRQGSLGGHADG